MLNEINAALDHLVALLHPSVDSDCFKQQVQSALLARYANVWFTSDPCRGSASRAILWHGHGGGEGQDEEIERACYANLLRKEEEDVAFFSSPFTLWIDPGCVAIRLGHGPGIYLSTTTIPTLQVKVIYEECSQQKTTSSSMVSPPILTLSPSTPALNGEHVPSAWSGASINNGRRMPLTMQNFHARSTSNSSMSSTFTASRSTSHGSSSYLSSSNEGELERCPSLTNTSARDSDSELSLEDMIESGCYKNFDIIDDEEEEEGLHGDETIGNVVPGDCENGEEDDDVGNVTLSPEDIKSSAPVTIVNYDGGNVGVLGGGIRLGASAAPSKPKKAPTALMTTKAPSPFASTYYPLSMQAGLWQAPTNNNLPPQNPSMYALEHSLGFSMPSHNLIDGYAIPLNRRVRSRGRRSRGRGAGRAARRQAAALQALSDAERNLAWPPTSSSSSQDEEAEHEGEDDKENDIESDERIMALVRQRADQVAKDLVKRHLEQERRKAATKLHEIQQASVYPHQQQQQLMMNINNNNKITMPRSTVAYPPPTTFYPIHQHLNAYPQQPISFYH